MRIGRIAALAIVVLGTPVAHAAPVAQEGGPVQAAPARTELGFQYSYQPSQIPLTTELVWGLDPDELNPHRTRWVLQRQSELVGLESVKRADGRFGVRALGIAAAAKSYLRPAGPWYRPLQEFPCTKKPVEWFANEDGTKKAVEEASLLWRELMSDRRLNLSIQLAGVSAGTPDIALLLGRHLFQTWLKQLDADWRSVSLAKAREREWQLYRELAKQTKVCETRKGNAAAASVPWAKMMEPVPQGDGPPKLLVRAPARRWNGLYSVRLDVVVGSQRMNGQFLIDSSAPKSVLSSQLLENQGVLSVFVAAQTGLPERVSGMLWPDPGLARPAVVDQVELSGKPLPIREFLVFDTDFFDPPEHVASCCDGVLGMDFLSGVVAEFSPGPPVEIKLWERGNYRAPAEQFSWTELSGELRRPRSDFSGLLSSSCEVRSGRNNVPGIRWNTSSTAFLQAHSPWAARARASKAWTLECDGVPFGQGLRVTASSQSHPAAGLDVRDPGLDAGMDFLGLAPFVFDLPHGRFWLTKSAREPARNTSGLAVKFVLKKGDRILLVEKIAPNSPAAKLAKAGLKPGQAVTHLNGQAVEELDAWDVEQILGGARGPRAELKWETKGAVKIAPLDLR